MDARTPWILFAGLVAAQGVVVVVARSGGLGLDWPQLAASAHGALAAIALVASGAAYAHWRVVGWVHGLRAAVALAVLGMLAAVEVVVGGAEPVHHAHFAFAVTAVVWIGRALLGHEIDTRLTATGEVLLAVLVAGVLWGLLAAIRPAFGNVGASTWSSLRGGLLLGVGALVVHASVRRGWTLLFWVAWAPVAMGLGELVAGTGIVGPDRWTLATAAMSFVGMAAAASGVIAALAQAADTRRGDAHGMVLDRRTQQARDSAELREFAHEVRNMALAISGAASGLTDVEGPVGHADRRRLREVLHASIGHLLAMVRTPVLAGTPSLAFRLDELVRERADAARARGVAVDVEATEPVEVMGTQGLTAQAIDNLLLNAERHGGAGRDARPIGVVVAHTVHGGTVDVRDHGPGLHAEDAEAIFEGARRAGKDGFEEGIGLPVARRVMRAQRGDLTPVQVSGPGACFRISLPVAWAANAAAGRPRAYVLEDRR